jgi:transcription elongation factor GreA
MKNPKNSLVQMTAEGAKTLRVELEDLKKVKLPAVLDRIAKAREDGDLSENGAYIFGKQEQEFLEGRISELEDILSNVVVVEGSQKSAVDLGCKVTVTLKGKQMEYYVVGEFEAKPSEKKISASSPLGQALLGKQVGDNVTVEAPVGKVVYTIVEIQ